MINKYLLAIFALGLLACDDITYHNPDRFEEVQIDNVLRLLVSNSTAPADGVSEIIITAIIPSEADFDKRIVKFSATHKVFVGTDNNTLEVGANKLAEAHAKLTSNEIISVDIKVSIGNVIQDATVSFERALPETLVVDPGASVIKPFTETTVIARLIRIVGTPTQGAPVNFSATDSTGASIGSFRNMRLSNVSGEASAIFSPLNTNYRGVIIICAQDVNTHIFGTASLIVINP